MCLSVYPHDTSKTDAARITKLDVQMSHDESWKLIYLGVKGHSGRSTDMGGNLSATSRAQNRESCSSSLFIVVDFCSELDESHV